MKRYVAVVGLLGLVVWIGSSVTGAGAQGTQSIEGVWRLVESGPEGGTMSPVQGGLGFYTATHYAFILDQADQPRPSISDFASASGDQFRATLEGFGVAAGTYELSGGELTSRPSVQLNGAMPTGVFQVTSYTVEGDTLTFTTRRTSAGPIPEPQTLVFTRVR